MELRQLEYLVAVAEEQGFTRAAGRVHVSQSGVSAQVRQLERELGAALIDRSSRTARLTDAGAAALPHARAALAAAAALRQSVDEVNGLVRGRLVVGMVTACTVAGLFDALAGFRRAHPGVALTLAEGDSADLAGRVRSGAADLALIGLAGDLPDDLGTFPVVSERLAVAAPPGHPLLAGRASVPLAALAGTDIVCMPAGSGIRAAFDAACAAQGVTLPVTLEASAPGAVADLAARGLGVAVLSESTASRPGLRAVPVDGPAVTARLALVWRPAPGPALRELIGHCRRAFTAAHDGPPPPPARSPPAGEREDAS
ncbi:MAG TPA: LysR substrate-binding domain-containing protein [Trebonia sp.]|jgi:DNA-binding transcriptional LysR family regulator